MSYWTEEQENDLYELHSLYARLMNPQVHYDLQHLAGSDLNTLEARVKLEDEKDELLDVIEDLKRLKNWEDQWSLT